MSLDSAKKNLIPNVATNFVYLVLSTIVGIFLTPYLIKKLGVAVYGIIPLVLSLVNHLGFFAGSISASVGRFISISINRNDDDRANRYFNTAVYWLLLLCLVWLVLGFLVSFFLENLINIPQNNVAQTKIFFIAAVVSFSLTLLCGPFEVSTFVSHRFDIRNYLRMSVKVVQPALLVCLFHIFSPSLFFVGLSYVVANGLFLLAIYFTRIVLTPALRLAKIFDFNCLKKMAGMIGWSMVDNVGALLYFGTDLLIINLLLGPESAGYYAPFIQLALLISLLVDALSDVFSPVAYEYIADKKHQVLADQTSRAIKFIGFTVALPIGLLCGMSKPLITLWLGDSFAQYHVLLWMLVGPGIILLPTRPVFAINRGYNKVALPAVVTIVGGVFNVVLSILFIKFSQLGVYGVALATFISFTLKNLFFAPWYSARLLGVSVMKFYIALIKGAMGVFAVAGISIVVIDFVSPSIISIAFICIGGTILYITMLYFLLFGDKDRDFVNNILGLG